MLEELYSGRNAGGQSERWRKSVLEMFENGIFLRQEPGISKNLKENKYSFQEIYDFAGKLRTGLIYWMKLSKRVSNLSSTF